MRSRREVLRGLERDPRRISEILVGLPDVELLGVLEGPVTEIHLECRKTTVGCPSCGRVAQLKEQRIVPFVDLPSFGRPTRLCWHKRRFRCPEPECPTRSWSEEDDRIASARMAMTTRAGRYVTEQVGRYARSVAEVARDLGCDWHTVNDTVLAYGEALVADPARYGAVSALGLDEVLFCRVGRFRRQQFSTQVVDVARGQLLDIVPGRSGKEPKAWLAARDKAWRDEVAYGTLDLSGPYRAVFEEMLPGATLVADPFHVVHVRHEAPCSRGRVRDPPLWAVAAAR